MKERSSRRTRTFQRARAPERKLERRDAILDVAEERVLREAYGAIHMHDVARRLQLTKGTLYLYFPSKEALFLGVLVRAFERFFAQADAVLADGRATRAEVEAALLAGLDASPSLPHLAAVLHSVLEHNVGDGELATFKRTLRERVLTLGARIDHALRWSEGSGAQLLLRFHVLMIGLHHVSTPSRAVERVLDGDDSLALFRIDFKQQLAEMLRLVMRPNPQEN